MLEDHLNYGYDGCPAEPIVLKVWQKMKQSPPPTIPLMFVFLAQFPELDYRSTLFQPMIFRDLWKEKCPPERRLNPSAQDMQAFLNAVDFSHEQMALCYNAYLHIRQVTHVIEKKLYLGVACKILKVCFGAGSQPKPIAIRCILLYDKFIGASSFAEAIATHVEAYSEGLVPPAHLIWHAAASHKIVPSVAAAVAAIPMPLIVLPAEVSSRDRSDNCMVEFKFPMEDKKLSSLDSDRSVDSTLGP